MKVYIIGAGPGDERYLTDYARDLILNASIVVASQRLGEQFWHLNSNITCKNIDELADFVLALRGKQTNVCMLISGDSGFFSISQNLCAAFRQADIEFECVSGISSLQYFSNALGVTYEDTVNLCAHSLENNVVPYVCYHPKVFVLTGTNCKGHDVISGLNAAGLGHVKVSVGENLGAENETVLTDTAANLTTHKCGDLAVLLIQNAAYAKYWQIITDAEFVCGQAPRTKQAARRLSLTKLQIEPDDVVVDIGAGEGSVSIEAARMAHRGRVFAIEKDSAALNLIRQNINKFGAYNVTVKEVAAPAGLDALPLINKAFIGGSDGGLEQIVAALLANNPGIKIVLNTARLETLACALAALHACGLDSEVMSINVALSKKSDPEHLMQAQNPVYIVSAAKA